MEEYRYFDLAVTESFDEQLANDILELDVDEDDFVDIDLSEEELKSKIEFFKIHYDYMKKGSRQLLWERDPTTMIFNAYVVRVYEEVEVKNE